MTIQLLNSPVKAVFRIFQLATIAVLIIYLPFFDANHSFKSYINDKVFFFLFGMGLLLVLQCILTVLSKENRKAFSFSWLDFTLLLYVMYITINKFYVAETERLNLESYQLIGLLVLYCIVRFLPVRYYKFLIGSMLLSGMIEAIYGCLQLYGVYPSEHHLFKITGSFFNPGPYAGYLSIIFSMALAIYLFFSRQANNPVFTKHTGTILKKFINPVAGKIKHIYCLHYNRCKRLNNHNVHRIKRFIAESIFWKKLSSTMKKFFSESSMREIIRKDRIAKLLSLITLITILLVLPASKSRASWMAALISSIYLVYLLYPIRKKIELYLNTLWKRMVSAMLVCIILAASGFAVYSLKKDSADGRLLIWKVSVNMIKDQPVIGHGFNKFQAHYMNYQADYFQNSPESEDGYYADNITYPFNEYIRIIAEQGMLGFLLLISIVMIIILLNRDNFALYMIIAKAGLLSLAVFAFFSYPSEILPIMATAVILLAIAAQQSATTKGMLEINLTGLGIRFFKTIKVVFPVISIALLIIIYPPIKNLHKAYCNWDEAYLLYNFEDYKSSIDSYKSASEELSSNGEFLIMYGKSLAMAAKYREAIEILQQAKKYQTNTILFTTLGDCYRNLTEFKNAEAAYLLAHYMVPNRFYPKYLLAKMYQESSQIEKAKSTAKELLSKPVKIESTAIKEIREEMKLLL